MIDFSNTTSYDLQNSPTWFAKIDSEESFDTLMKLIQEVYSELILILDGEATSFNLLKSKIPMSLTVIKNYPEDSASATLVFVSDVAQKSNLIFNKEQNSEDLIEIFLQWCEKSYGTSVKEDYLLKFEDEAQSSIYFIEDNVLETMFYDVDFTNGGIIRAKLRINEFGVIFEEFDVKVADYLDDSETLGDWRTAE